MSIVKILIFLLVVAIGLGILGGVIEVKYNQEELAAVLPNMIGAVTDAGTYESVRARGVGYKRQAEQWLVKDVDQKLQLAFQYVVQDTERLNEVLEKKSESPEAVLPQAELLIKSIDRIGDLLVEAPAATVASAQKNTAVMLGDARGALSHLQDLEQNNPDSASSFAQVNSVLEWHIGEFDKSVTDGISAVAGDRDDKTEGKVDEEGASADEEIPLEF